MNRVLRSCFLTLTILIHNFECSRSKVKESVISSTLKSLKEQQQFMAYNFISDISVIDSATKAAINDIIRKISASSPVTNYDINVLSRGKIKVSKKKNLKIRHWISSSVPLIYLYASDHNIASKEITRIAKITFKQSSLNNVPKVLFMLITKKRVKSHKKLLKQLFDDNILNVDLLIIRVRSERKNLLRSLSNKNCNVILHQWNPFFDNHTLSRNVTNFSWFPNKVKNLNKWNMGVAISKRHIKVIKSKSKQITKKEIRTMGRLQRNLLKAIMATMNVSVTLHYVEKDHKTLFAEVPSIQYATDHSGLTSRIDNKSFAMLKPLMFATERASAPFMTDSFTVFNGDIYKLIIACFCIIVIIWVYALFAQFDLEVWSTMSIFGLLMGIGTPRDVNKLAERIMLIFVLLAGVAFGEDIFMGMTSFNFPLESEIKIETLESMLSCNMTPLLSENSFHLLQLYEKNKTIRDLMEKKMKIVDIYSKECWDCFHNLITFKNYSCPVSQDTEDAVANSYGKQKPPILRICGWTYTLFPITHRMKPYSPFIDRISNIYWRFVQGGFFKYNKERKQKGRIKIDWKLFQKKECDSYDEDFVTRLHIILLTEVFVSFLLFFVEIAYSRTVKCKCSKNIY